MSRIPLAAAGLLNPLIAAAAMALSSVVRGLEQLPPPSRGDGSGGPDVTALPAWGVVTLAAVMAACGLVAAARLAIRQPRTGASAHAVDVCHLLMAGVMVAIVVGAPLLVGGVVWAIVFCAFAVWFGHRLIRGLTTPDRRPAALHYTPHAVTAGAMAYMVVAMRPMPVVSAAELICGSRMLGMTAAAPGGALSPPALALGLVCFAAAVFAVEHKSRRDTESLALVGGVTPDRAVEPRYSEVGIGGPFLDAGSGAPAPAEAPCGTLRRRTDWLVGAPVTAGCHVAMAVAMGAMLVTMR